MENKQWRNLSSLSHWGLAEGGHNLRRCRIYGSWLEAAAVYQDTFWGMYWQNESPLGLEMVLYCCKKLGTRNFSCLVLLSGHPWVSSGAKVLSFRKLGCEGSWNCAWSHFMVTPSYKNFSLFFWTLQSK